MTALLISNILCLISLYIMYKRSEFYKDKFLWEKYLNQIENNNDQKQM